MNRRAKCDAASFVLCGEMRNRTNTQKTHRQTVNDISTPCLSACVDNKPVYYGNLLRELHVKRRDL